MDRLWARDEPATVRELHTDLSAQRRLAYTTVLTVVDNLYKKGWLRREPAGRAFRYRPVTSREEYSARLMHEALDASGNPAAALLAVAGLLLARLAFTAYRAIPGAIRWRRHHIAGLHLVGRGGPRPDVTVVDHPIPNAYLVAARPTPLVVVTSAAVESLSDGELAAVIAHERAHAAGRHHLLIAALRLLHDAFPASRLFSQAHAEVSRLVEERADDTATRHHNPLDLARALVTIAEGTAHDPADRAPAAPAPALGAAGGEAAARVHRLINPPSTTLPPGGDPALPHRGRAAAGATRACRAYPVVAGPDGLPATLRVTASGPQPARHDRCAVTLVSPDGQSAGCPAPRRRSVSAVRVSARPSAVSSAWAALATGSRSATPARYASAPDGVPAKLAGHPRHRRGRRRWLADDRGQRRSVHHSPDSGI